MIAKRYPMQRERCRELVLALSVSQRFAMVSDDLSSVPLPTRRVLAKRGYVRRVEYRFWAFTLQGRRLRAAMFRELMGVGAWAHSWCRDRACPSCAQSRSSKLAVELQRFVGGAA